MKKPLIALFLFLALGVFWASRQSGSIGESPAPPPQGSAEADEPAPAASAEGDPVDTPALTEERPAPESAREASLPAGAVTSAIDRLRKALASLTGEDENWEEVEAATKALAELLGEDPDHLRQAFAAFATESNPALLHALAPVIAPHISWQESEFHDAVLELARESDSPEMRSAALSMLFAMPRPSEEVMDFVLGRSREDESVDVRLTSIYLISQWATNDPSLSDRFSRELVKTIDASDHPTVRGTAIQTIALKSGVHRAEILAAMDEYMTHDPSPQNRSIAALALGGVEAELREPAMKLLEHAFAGETHFDTRRNIMTQIARVGGEEAIFTLLQLPTDDSILEQDVKDYVELLQSGDDDFDEIYSRKFALDAERGTVVGASSHSD